MKKPRAGTLLLHAALLFGAAVTLMPLVWMVGASFMEPGEANSLPPRLLPAHPTIQNFVVLFTRLDFLRNLANSVVVTVLATVLSVLVNSLAGYSFAKLPFRGREKLFKALASALVVLSEQGFTTAGLLAWLEEAGFPIDTEGAGDLHDLLAQLHAAGYIHEVG